MGWYCDHCGMKNIDPWAGGQGQPAPHCDTSGCPGNPDSKKEREQKEWDYIHSSLKKADPNWWAK